MLSSIKNSIATKSTILQKYGNYERFSNMTYLMGHLSRPSSVYIQISVMESALYTWQREGMKQEQNGINMGHTLIFMVLSFSFEWLLWSLNLYYIIHCVKCNTVQLFSKQVIKQCATPKSLIKAHRFTDTNAK